MWNRLIELLEIGLPKPFPFRVSAKHLFQSPDTVMKYAPRIEMLFDYLPDFAGIGLDFLRCVLARREVKRQNHELKFTEFLKLSLIVPCDIAVRDMKHPAAFDNPALRFPFLCRIVGGKKIIHCSYPLNDVSLSFRTFAAVNPYGGLVTFDTCRQQRVNL